ncbi:UDP-N-acetyl-D-glucosamine dehydrogenase [Microbispora rosea subsp. aerata]|nr:nucleotide sugar dehydrogenase [Microbispora rosea]GGO18639.1 UDP-N-acetyl-D-glucosamine dehydrogenase [Microbispora rosea subsp. aerata]GIH54352.1 UDP-N-acetyl-D-glucosamine dehydrogenase [Microbispora rosea subsp. aerata]GLJ81322.1 UDP-N-acetyl-D-glucosamine dehydrogenase [Microbispora rosea subsp. aerata]
MAEKLVVVGQDRAGLPLAMRAVEAGFRVVGLDEDVWRVKRLNAGEPCVEGVGAGALAAAHASGRYTASADPGDASGFDVCVLTSPTRMRNGAPDLGPLGSAAGRVAPFLRPGATVILEGTVYPGTTEEFVRPLLEHASGLCAGDDFHLGHSPHRAEPGNPRWRLGNTPKVVSGVDAASLRAVTDFYGRLVRETVPVSSPRVSELCALLETARAHVGAALANELSIFAAHLGVDVWEAAEAAATTPFRDVPMTPGPGLEEPCLPLDVAYLPWGIRRGVGRGFRLVEAANDVNAHMPAHVVDRLGLALNRRCRSIRGSRILLLGLSPVEVAKTLCRLGARVRAADPQAEDLVVPAGVELVEPDAAELARADVVVVLGGQDCFDYDLVQRAGRFVFDTRGRCRGPNVERL